MTDNVEDLADIHWLIGDDAAKQLRELSDSPEEPLRMAARLRRAHSANRTRLLLEQIELRKRAIRKFALANQMFFTRTALEQATDEHVAIYKAGRFAGHSFVADFCCGIGGDFLAMSRLTTCIGVERDPVAAAFAAANLAVLRRADQFVNESRVVARSATVADAAASDAWHVDPDRRPTGKRTTRAELHEPSPRMIDELLQARSRGAVKLAPAAVFPDRWSSEAELEWISRGGECRQLVVWFGELAAATGRRRATAVAREASSFVGAPNTRLPAAESVQRYCYELDASLLASKLAGSFMAECGIAALSHDGGYATSDRLHPHQLLVAFETLDVLPPRIRLIKAWLEARKIGRVELKCRGVDADPAQWVRQLRGKDSEEATILLTRHGGKPVAVITKRIPRAV